MPTRTKTKRQRGNKAATRKEILDAAQTLIAQNGANNLALTDVVRLSGVHRATVYQHFRTRDELLKAAADRFSEQFHEAVLGDSAMQVDPRPESDRILEWNTRFTDFVMNNPELCRIWLFEVLNSSDPASDPVWKEYEEAFRSFFKTDLAQVDLDSEVMAVLVLAGGVLWPVWARAQTKTEAERKELASRFRDTLLRMAMWGSMKPEFFPELAEFLKGANSSQVDAAKARERDRTSTIARS